MQLIGLALATTASALVVIPALSSPEGEAFRAVPLVDGTSWGDAAADSHVVRVPCGQCGDADRELLLGFGVADGTRLLLNGREVYPRVEAVVMGVGARPKSQLGYSLGVFPEAAGPASRPRLVDVELRVMEVGDRFVDGVPAVSVRLLEAQGGRIVIADVAVAPSRVSGCDSLACRAREGVADALRALRGLRPWRGCHGHGRGRGSGWHLRGGEHRGGRQDENAAMQLPQGGDSWASLQSRRHEWRRILTHIAAQVLLPVLMGITAGVGVALFAMGLCSLLFRLAASVRGKRSETRAAGPSAAATTSDEAFASEKDRLVEPAELPPQYEDEDEDGKN
ncbi:hypothetical protein E4U42_005931 [Claviceps africana]|uniref:DUF7728 domain-containing protein n=1 Tax=Claviceps africana TaxID=83212 RepID=A0A8K0J335_9HYPO|nr:hypothetical protein E4U42_005931 [Claviceps africana]